MARESVPTSDKAGKKSQIEVKNKKEKVRGMVTIFGNVNLNLLRVATSIAVATPCNVKNAVAFQVGFVKFM